MKLQIRAVIVYTYRVAYIYIREDISTKWIERFVLLKDQKLFYLMGKSHMVATTTVAASPEEEYPHLLIL
jgi:hypothetical protein